MNITSMGGKQDHFFLPKKEKKRRMSYSCREIEKKELPPLPGKGRAFLIHMPDRRKEEGKALSAKLQGRNSRLEITKKRKSFTKKERRGKIPSGDTKKRLPLKP